MLRATRRFPTVCILSCAALLFGAGWSAAATCDAPGSALVLDWSDAAWNGGSLSGELLADRVTRPGEGLTQPVEVSVTGKTRRLLSGYPRVSSEMTGGRGAATDSFAVDVDFANRSETLVVSFDFSEPVRSLSFDIFDVDFLDRWGQGNFRFQRGFRDGVTVSGYDGAGAEVAPVLGSPHIPTGRGSAAGATVFLGSPLEPGQAVGYDRLAPDDTDAGNVEVRFAMPVQRVTVEFTGGLNAPSPTPQAQGIALSDITFCQPLGAQVAATKTQRLISETGLGCRDFDVQASAGEAAAIPGACIEYRISVRNFGEGTAEDLELTDVLDENLVYQAARTTGFEGVENGPLLTRPQPGQDCGRSECVLRLRDASLAAGASGQVVVRATIR